MKPKFSLTAILGATALTAGVLFANPAMAEPCSMAKFKDLGSITNALGMKFKQLNPLQIGFLGVGSVAAVATAGWLVTKKGKETPYSDILVSDISDDLFNETSFPIYVPLEALETTTEEVEEEEVSTDKPTSLG